jgi:hypothetical protein
LLQHQGTRLVKGTSNNDDLGQRVLVALGGNSDSYIAGGRHVSAVEDYARLGTAPRILPPLSYREMPGGCDDPGCGAGVAPRR